MGRTCFSSATAGSRSPISSSCCASLITSISSGPVGDQFYLFRLGIFSAAERIRGDRAHPFVDGRRLAAPLEVRARFGGLAVVHEVKADDEVGVGTLRLGYRREDLIDAFDVEGAIAFLD